MSNVHLLLIDPQNDFVQSDGAMSVPGAADDMNHLAAMIARLGNKIHNITTSLDTHHKLHISNPDFWLDENGEKPQPFTQIGSDDIESGKWKTRNPEDQNHALLYTAALEQNERFKHTVWPEHCLQGSIGAAVWENLFEALLNWEEKNGVINYVPKGSNIYTEHFGILKAEVEIEEDPQTKINVELLRALQDADEIPVAGEASSHCVATSLLDLVEAEPSLAPKFTLLLDATSPVPGFEDVAKDAVKKLRNKGVKHGFTDTYLK